MKKKVKKVARKPRSPSHVQDDSKSRAHSDLHEHAAVHNEIEGTTTTSQSMASEPIPTQSTAKVSSLISTSVPLTSETFHVPSPPHSPTITSTLISTPITIATCPNVSVGVSQPQISVAQTTPLYTDSTTTTSATSSPPVTVNVFDTGTGTFGVTVGPSSSTVLPLRVDDHDMIFGDDRDDFQDFHYSRFTIHQESDDDDEPMTKGQFKALNKKLDTLLESSKSSSNSEYSFEADKALIETH